MNPTVAAIKQIDHTTPLDEMDLNWSERELPERVRTKHVHRLHPYLGKFIPQLVEIFLRRFFEPGQVIYDPFCGSGTTLVEANVLGMPVIGCDISEFNCLLSKVKTDEYDMPRMQSEVRDILGKVSQHFNRKQAPLLTQAEEIPEGAVQTDNEYLRNWYAPQALKQLLLYRHFISQYEYQDLLRIILSRSARSARLTTHFDLDFPKEPQREPYYCYKHSRTCKPVQEALKFLSRYSQDTIRRIKEFGLIRTDSPVTVICGDAREIRLNGKIDGVITSPPYVGLIDYHEQHRYAYEFLALKDRRGQEIGSADKGKSAEAVEVYCRQIAKVFRNCAEALKDDGVIIIVVNDDKAIYGKIVQEAGLTVRDRVNRHVNRRTGRRSTEFYEQVLITQKAKTQ